MRILPLLILGIALSGRVAAQPYLLDLQEDHIAANVPSQEDFSRFLERDLLAHFRSEDSPDVVSVSWSMLREGATQSGVSYPKFYLWIRATSKSGEVAEGAVRVAAIDRSGFDVTHFITSAEILDEPEAVSSTFPAALVPAILANAEESVTLHNQSFRPTHPAGLD